MCGLIQCVYSEGMNDKTQTGFADQQINAKKRSPGSLYTKSDAHTLDAGTSEQPSSDISRPQERCWRGPSDLLAVI